MKKARNEGTVRFMTRAQAIGNLYMAQGETEKAVEIYREVLEKGSWTGGVYLCAEAELKRLGLSP